MPEEKNGKPELKTQRTGRMDSLNAKAQETKKQGMTVVLKSGLVAFKNTLTGATKLDLLKKLLENSVESFEYEETGIYIGQLEYCSRSRCSNIDFKKPHDLAEKILKIKDSKELKKYDAIVSETKSKTKLRQGQDKYLAFIDNCANQNIVKQDIVDAMCAIIADRIFTSLDQDFCVVMAQYIQLKRNDSNDKESFLKLQKGDYIVGTVLCLYTVIKLTQNWDDGAKTALYKCKSDGFFENMLNKTQCDNLYTWCNKFLSDYEKHECEPTHFNGSASYQIEDYMRSLTQYQEDCKNDRYNTTIMNMHHQALNNLIYKMRDMAQKNMNQEYYFRYFDLQSPNIKQFCEHTWQQYSQNIKSNTGYESVDLIIQDVEQLTNTSKDLQKLINNTRILIMLRYWMLSAKNTENTKIKKAIDEALVIIDEALVIIDKTNQQSQKSRN